MKDDFEILNDVKMNVDDYEEVKFDNNDELKNKMKIKIRNRNKNKRFKRGIVAASLLAILSSGIILDNNIWADIERFWYSLGDIVNMKKEELEDYKYNINKVAIDKNVKISLKDVILDNGSLILNLNVDYSKFNPFKDFTEKQQKEWSFDKWGREETLLTVGEINNIYIDGVKYEGQSWAIGDHYQKKEKSVDVVMEQGIDMTIKEGNDINSERVKKDEFPYVINKDKIYNFKIQIKKLHLEQDWESQYKSYDEVKKAGGPHSGIIRGNWEFNIDIKGEDLIDKSKSYSIDEVIEFSLNNKVASIEFSEVIASPLSVEIKYKFLGINNVDFDRIRLKVKDENNKEIIPDGMNVNNGTHEVVEKYKNTSNNYSELKIVPTIVDDKYNVKEVLEDKAIKVKLD
ncbi:MULTISPECIES: DUF4179 domain-containing protein [Romboutsia]|uniref:DUF4179 domain-containing protein n=1 Tax=Romboutsia TaxID=1501226 RepID=UPI000B80D730|nr:MULTISPECIES: DUF4179 domain-containing protein [Romboutsia]MCH1959172.1 DUF4179 domain-containing protein [Romboutsia hominis]MCH1968292.1 DUF4179 domain-containing protein [Romboutsia hominis]MDB8789537.1 DUF4179 domain-containing protein [Romboutsia sp. 1001216sp1]MDB8802680.1 DUF4179 domain-containing protein [Romboutsia sp. 1001216sp1]MDB8805500.1 DUF4179 domain-containing protein [Romboutsia sp. 1001216sp1]